MGDHRGGGAVSQSTVRGEVDAAGWEVTDVVHEGGAFVGHHDQRRVVPSRHAGVNEATIDAAWRAGAFEVEIVDQGVGFEPSAVGAGRLGVRDRIIGSLAAIGGRVRIDSRPGAGTRVVMTAPPSAAAPLPRGDWLPGVLVRIAPAMTLVVAGHVAVGALHLGQGLTLAMPIVGMVAIPVCSVLVAVLPTSGRPWLATLVSIGAVWAGLLINVADPSGADWRIWFIGAFDPAVALIAARTDEQLRLRQAAEIAAAQASALEAEITSRQQGLDADVLPMLRLIAERAPLSGEQRARCRDLEAATRDQLVGATLLSPDLMRSIAGARRRGVRVTIVGRAQATDDVEPFRTASAALLAGGRRGDRVTLRWAPDGETLATAVLVGPDADARPLPELGTLGTSVAASVDADAILLEVGRRDSAGAPPGTPLEASATRQ